jgi:hypothetical protein
MFVTGKYALRVFCSELLRFLMEGQGVVRRGLLSVRFSLTAVCTVEPKHTYLCITAEEFEINSTVTSINIFWSHHVIPQICKGRAHLLNLIFLFCKVCYLMMSICQYNVTLMMDDS